MEGSSIPCDSGGLDASIPWRWISSYAKQWAWIESKVAEGVDQWIRTAAIRLMAHASSEKKMDILLPILERGDPKWIPLVLEAFGAESDPRLTDCCLEQLRGATPILRAELVKTLRNEPNRFAKFLEALESKKVSMKWLDASQIQSLANIKDPAFQPRVAKLLEGMVNKDREKVVEAYRLSLEMKSDAHRGQKVFEKNCASCHRIDQVGFAVGPDISDSREQTLEKLLIAILDPNRAIDNNYFRYIAVKDDGEVVEGIMREATAHTVTLRSQNGKEILLQRSEISDLKSSGNSLMPEGVESQIGLQEMADLLSYIKNWRYPDGLPE